MAFLSPLAASYPTAYPVFLLALLAQAVPAEEITVVLAPGEAPPRQPWPFPLDSRGHHSGTAHGRLSPAGRTDHLLCL